MSLLEIDTLSFAWPDPSGRVGKPAIDGLGLAIEAGEYLAVVGANGSGKSTLLRLVAGLLAPDRGSVRLEGLEASLPANRHRVRSLLSLVFQSPVDQIVSSVVEEDVAFGPENLGLERSEIAQRVDEALAAVGLLEERRRPSFHLSPGQMQRLALAGALAMRPRCIAFDEASSMLDPPSRASLLDHMDALNSRGLTILHVTHDMDEAARAKRLVALEGGRVVWDGTSAAFFEADPSGRVPSLDLGLGLPDPGKAARALGLPLRAREGVEALSRRFAAVSPPSRLPGPSAVETGAPAAKGGGEAGEAAYLLEAASYCRLRGTMDEVRAIDGLSLRLARGDSLALVGHTGSGKSSLLELCAALAKPCGGSLRVLGLDPLARGTDLAALRMRSPLAIQRPESALFEAFAGDDVAFGPRNRGLSGKSLVDRVRRWMGEVDLDYAAFRDRPVRSLSGGEKRRLALAGVLALESEALLLDEPTQALDPATRGTVHALIARLRGEGRTLILATHSMEEAAAADLVAVLRAGRLVALGPPSRIFFEDYDPGWGIARPFAVELALALEAEGFVSLRRPLDLDALASALGLPNRPNSATAGPAAAGQAAGRAP